MAMLRIDKRVSNTKRRFYVTCPECGETIPASHAIRRGKGHACQTHGKLSAGPSEKALKRRNRR